MRILVSGAGIASLAARINLGAAGHDVTITECADHLRTNGSPKDIRGDTIDITHRMGIFREIDKRRIAMNESSRFIDDGTVLGEIPSAEVGDSAEDPEIPREDLTHVLTHSLPASTSLIMSESIDRLHDNGEGVDVTFVAGTSDRFDLVVGADGKHSLTRKLIFGPGEDYLTHLGFYGAHTKLSPKHGPDKYGYALNWPGPPIGITHYHQTTLGVMNFRAPWIDYDYRDLDEQKQILLDAITNHNKWRVHEILDSAYDDPELYFDSVRQIHMPAWHAGRAVLAGDAAHSVSLLSGRGTSLAILGKWFLARVLDRHAEDIYPALRQYEEDLRPYVTHAQDSADPGGDLIDPDTHDAINARNKRLLTFSR